MSSAQLNAGETQAKTEQFVESAKNRKSEAQDKVSHIAEKTSQEIQRSTEENANILQQTGERMADMAQGAIDGLKNTLGMGDKK